MATFIMFGKYSPESLKGISGGRTKKFTDLIKKLGGKVTSMHALLGSYDLIFIVELPSVQKALEASVTLGKLTGIAFTTSPAVSIQEFDKMAGK